MTLLAPAPRPARTLLRALLPADWRDDVVANLEDLHAARARRWGQRRADAWFWRQAVSCPIRLRLAGTEPVAPLVSTRTSMMRTIGQDLRYAWRLHRSRPGFAVVALLSLAVGIGFNTAIFSVVHGVLLRPAPVERLDQLAMIWETDRDTGTTREPGSLPDLLDYRARSQSFSEIGGLIAQEVSLTPPTGDPTRLAALAVSDSLLPMLGIQAAIGRGITEDDTRPGAEQVVLISESLWTRMFDRDAGILGRRLMINEAPATVVGVVADSTDFGVLQILGHAAYARSFADHGQPVRVDVWTALTNDPAVLPRSTHPVLMVGRLAANATLPSASEEMTRIAADLEAEYPRDNAARGVNLESLDTVVFGSVRPALLALLGAVALVLLVACANVANLMLARGAARQREVAVRVALGAPRGRLFRQFMTESIALSLVAAIGGIGLAYGGLAALVSLAPADVPRLASAGIDLTVLAATIGVAVLAGVLFGIVPAVHAGGHARSAALGESTRATTGGRERVRLRNALVVAELALAVVLVVGATLLIRSLWNLSQIDPGFRSAGVVKAEFQLPRTRYPVDFAVWPNFREFHAFNAALEAKAATLAGVEAVAIAGNHPLDPGFTNSFAIIGREAESRSFPEISIRRVTPGYFDTIGLEVVSGRALRESDTTLSAKVLLINQAGVERFFPDQDPLGHELSFWGDTYRIVGVVGDELFQGLTNERPIAIYAPLSQTPSTNGLGVLLARTDGDPAALGPSLVRAIREVDPALAVFGVETLDATKARSMSEERFTLILLGLFAAMALGLAAVGVHGVLSYGVTERTREFGIRLALGARPDRLQRSVVRQGLVLAGTGLALGIAGALLLTRMLQSLLYAVTPTDPITLAAVVGILTIVALVASWVPARRVTRIDPNDALRVEG